MPFCYVQTSLDAEGNTNTTNGEQHPGDNQTAWFRYGQTADSDVEFGIQNPIGSAWGVSGSAHVGNGRSAYVQWNVGAQWGYKVRTGMHYKKYRHTWNDPACGNGYLTAKATDWNGGAILGDNVHSLDNNCRNMSGTRSAFYRNTEFDRRTYKATWFTGAASAFGASLRAQSGFSTYVISHWNFGSNYTYY
jgi:hypothetical protein